MINIVFKIINLANYAIIATVTEIPRELNGMWIDENTFEIPKFINQINLVKNYNLNVIEEF